MEAVVLDLESATVDDVSAAVAGADAVVFAAGAGPGSGAARKDTVDRAAAVLLADAAEWAGVPNYLLVSSVGVDLVADGPTPPGRRRGVRRLPAGQARSRGEPARPRGPARHGPAAGRADRRPRHRAGHARPNGRA